MPKHFKPFSLPWVDIGVDEQVLQTVTRAVGKVSYNGRCMERCAKLPA